jgi:hypothetical protein
MKRRPDTISFMICRTAPRTKLGYRTEWLAGDSPTGEARDEAQSLVDDPRDTITSVSLWSNRHEQFVGLVRKQKKPTV